MLHPNWITMSHSLARLAVSSWVAKHALLPKNCLKGIPVISLDESQVYCFEEVFWPWGLVTLNWGKSFLNRTWEHTLWLTLVWGGGHCPRRRLFRDLWPLTALGQGGTVVHPVQHCPVEMAWCPPGFKTQSWTPETIQEEKCARWPLSHVSRRPIFDGHS